MNDQVAILFPALNSAIYRDGEEIYHMRYSEDPVLLDAYQFSQIENLKPEVIEVPFNSIGEIREIMRTEYAKFEALTMTIELMDPDISIGYKVKIVDHLNEILENQIIYSFVSRRINGTVKPKAFTVHHTAMSFIKVHSPLSNIFLNFDERNKLFGDFYTTLLIELHPNESEKAQMDMLLTESGLYEEAGKALELQSSRLYRSVIIRIAQELRKIFSSSQDLLIENLLNVQNKLEKHNSIVLRIEDKPVLPAGKILLVNEDMFENNLIKDILMEKSNALIHVENIERVFTSILEFKPDIIILCLDSIKAFHIVEPILKFSSARVILYSSHLLSENHLMDVKLPKLEAICRSSNPEVLVNAVECVNKFGYKGDFSDEYLWPPLHILTTSDQNLSLVSSFSPRELNILNMLSRGMSTHQIGRVMHLAPSIIAMIRIRIMKKLAKNHVVKKQDFVSKFGIDYSIGDSSEELFL